MNPDRKLAGEDRLNMTRLALNLSDYVNGVAKRHAEVSHPMFPGYEMHAITNGVHPYTWTSDFSPSTTTFFPDGGTSRNTGARGQCPEPAIGMRTRMPNRS